MSPLSTELLDVVSTLPQWVPEKISAELRKTVEAQTVALDALAIRVEGAQPTVRAELATQASQLLFAERAVTPEASSYKDLRQKNW